MEQKLKSFKDLLKFGQEGEKEVAEILISKNIATIPLYQFISDSTPIIITKDQNYTLPDLICFKNISDCFFVEVKTKNKWVKFNNKFETGMNERLYKEYKAIKEVTGRNVYVFFNHKKQNPVGIYAVELDSISRIWDGLVEGVKVHEKMVFYNKESLELISQ